MSVNSGYTNGFNSSRVFDAMLKRLGWKQSTVSGATVLSSDNTTANSGRYFNDFHALCSAQILKAVQEDANISDVNFNSYLLSLQRGVILRCLNGVLNAPENIERVLAYDRSTDNEEALPNQGKFVGFEIKTAKDDRYSVKVEEATFLFNENVTFDLYLFKEGVKTPVKTKSCVVVANESTVITFDDWILNYLSATKGSRFFIGYFQSDLGSAQAIREQTVCWTKGKCFSLHSMEAPATGSTEFDKQNISWSYEANGINLQVSTFRDHTNAVVSQCHLFDEVIGLQMAYTILEQIIYATRSNETERILKDQIVKAGLQLELLGAIAAPDSPQITGLKSRIDRELARVKKAFYPSPKAVTVNYAGY